MMNNTHPSFYLISSAVDGTRCLNESATPVRLEIA